MSGGGIRCTGLAVALLALPVAAPAQLDEALVGEHVVTVRVYDDSGEFKAQGAGVVVGAGGEVLTSAAVLGAGTRMVVVAQGEDRELEARQQWKERNSGLALLRVGELERAGLAVSVAELKPGLRVSSVTPGEGAGGAGVAGGSVTEVGTERVGGEEVGFVRHNARIAARGYGSPLVDECSRVVGLNVPDPDAITVFTAPRKIEPGDTVFAVSGEEMAARLGGRGVEFVQVAEGCVSAEERAQEHEREANEAREAQEQAEAREAQTQQKLEESERQLEESEQRLRQAETDAQASEQEKAQARSEAERARQEVEVARTQASQAREATAQAERAVQEANRRADAAGEREREQRRRTEQLRRYAEWGVAGGAALLVLLLLLWALSARRRRGAMRRAQARAAAAEQEAVQVRRRAAPAPFDCVLTGTDGEGAPCAVNVGRAVLGGEAGVVVGRDPSASSHVVVDPSVSRRHARLSVEDGELCVEDLGSTNGTYLNGRRLEPGRHARVADGDELELGSVRLRVELRD